jgi:hypothetical protein
MALLGAVIVIGLIVYAFVRIRRRAEAAEAERLNKLETIGSEHSSEGDEER